MVMWKYAEPMEDRDEIEKFERDFGYAFENAYVKCAMHNNGGYPSKNSYDTNKATGRTIKKLLSFNEEDAENIWKINRLLGSKDSGFVVFAIDSFGNAICFARDSGAVVFIDHESDEVEQIAASFEDFLGALKD